mmetsp:Transcript_1243/g.3703  ORF Transcript_1243/g.3703 Transcript_1243/m.3703 type:complete len:335 (+) Transcript_1243:1997-3001(+)
MHVVAVIHRASSPVAACLRCRPRAVVRRLSWDRSHASSGRLLPLRIRFVPGVVVVFVFLLVTVSVLVSMLMAMLVSVLVLIVVRKGMLVAPAIVNVQGGPIFLLVPELRFSGGQQPCLPQLRLHLVRSWPLVSCPKVRLREDDTVHRLTRSRGEGACLCIGLHQLPNAAAIHPPHHTENVAWSPQMWFAVAHACILLAHPHIVAVIEQLARRAVVCVPAQHSIQLCAGDVARLQTVRRNRRRPLLVVRLASKGACWQGLDVPSDMCGVYHVPIGQQQLQRMGAPLPQSRGFVSQLDGFLERRIHCILVWRIYRRVSIAGSLAAHILLIVEIVSH